MKDSLQPPSLLDFAEAWGTLRIKWLEQEVPGTGLTCSQCPKDLSKL